MTEKQTRGTKGKKEQREIPGYTNETVYL